MVTKAEHTSSGLDTVKLLGALSILIAGVVGFYYFEDESQLLRVIGMLVVAGIAFFIVSMTDVGRRSLGFVKDARVEVRKVVWPTRQETLQTTLAVLVMVVIVAIMLWLIDLALGTGVKQFTRIRQAHDRRRTWLRKRQQPILIQRFAGMFGACLFWI